MKTEYASAIASAAMADDTIAAVAAGPVTEIRRMKRPRKTIIDNATSTTHSYYDGDDGDGDDYCSGIMKKGSQPLQQQEQQQQQQQQHEQELELELEQHPYMSLYEPLLFATASPQQQEPDEISSSSFAIAKQLPQPPQTSSLSPQINATTSIYSIYRAKKRQRMTTTTTKIDDSDISIAEDAIQSVVDKEDTKMIGATENDDGHDRITDSHIANNEKEGDDASFDSSNDEAIIERIELATKKKMKSGDDDGDDDDDDAAIFDCSEYEAAIDDGHDSIDTSRMENITVDDDSFNSSDDEAVIDEGHDRTCASRMENDDDTNNNDDSVWKLEQKANNIHWIEMYHRLVAYKKDHKDTKVPKGYSLDPQLGIWANNQRAVHRNKKMTEDHKRLLNSIGFAWENTTKQKRNTTNKLFARWEEMYQRLVAYKKEHKDTNVPQNYTDPKLACWVRYQRMAHRNKKMTEERKHLLNSVGFVWELLTKNKATWEEMYQRLLAYKKEHKDTKVTYNYTEDPQLASWVSTQRVAQRNEKMTEERKHLLNSVGFVWELYTRNKATWEEMYQRLVAYKKEHKLTMFPTNYKEDPQLGHWVHNQRTAHRNKKMTEERKHLFNSIGLVWELSTKQYDTKWEEMYQRLVAYKNEYKHTMIPTNYKEDPKLACWVRYQRIAHRNKKLTEERKCLLDSIGFVWELSTKNKAPWEEMYQRLVAYKKDHKDTNVPQKYKEDPTLARWVGTQRVVHRDKKMTEERKHLLNSIGFVWELYTKNKAPWEEMYQRLLAYKKKHKHTMVPKRYEEHSQLGNWIKNQRVVHRNKKMTEERKQLLNSIDFVWELNYDAKWEEIYQRLIAYKKEHKDTNVPQNYKEDPKLACWVTTQRVVHRDKNMTEERKRLLNSIGFVWELSTKKNEAWEGMYQRLVAYKKEHKDTNVPYNYKEDPKLASWVHNQRTAHRNKKMTEERKHLLNSIGFLNKASIVL